MLAELLGGLDEAVGNAFEKCSVSERADDYALATRFGDKIGMYEKL
jgi:hypothetical protein